jgi:hypothetical protein
VTQSAWTTPLDWPVPKTTTELSGFLGICNYYRKFIRHFSKLALQLTDLLQIRPQTMKKQQKKAPLDCWGTLQSQEFEMLKTYLTTAPILLLFD